MTLLCRSLQKLPQQPPHTSLLPPRRPPISRRSTCVATLSVRSPLMRLRVPKANGWRANTVTQTSGIAPGRLVVLSFLHMRPSANLLQQIDRPSASHSLSSPSFPRFHLGSHFFLEILSFSVFIQKRIRTLSVIMHPPSKF